MSRLLTLTILAPLLVFSVAPAEAKGSACWYWQDQMGLAKHANCLVHRGKHPLRVNPTQLRKLQFEGKYTTIFSEEHGWMYVSRDGVVVVQHVMPMDNGADYIVHGFVRYTHNGKCGYASLGNDPTISPQFDGCLPFSGAKAQVCNGCRVVSDGEYHFYRGGHSFCINSKGQHVSCEPNHSSKR